MATLGPHALQRWLVEHDLATPATTLDGLDVLRLQLVRDGFRSVLLGHAADGIRTDSALRTGNGPDLEALDDLSSQLAEIPLAWEFTPTGHRLVALDGTRLGTAIAGLVDAVREAAESDAWARLRVCARPSCRRVFYDASRNRSRRWCSMAGCGSTIKMRRAAEIRASGRRADANDPAV